MSGRARLPPTVGIAFVLAAVVGAAAPVSAAGAPLRINVAASWPLHSADGKGLVDRVLRQAARRARLRFELQALPAERSLRNANAGLDDGDGPRVFEMDQIFPALVRVPEPLVTYDFVAVTREPALQVQRWEDLAGRHVAIIRGWKIVERQVQAPASLVAVRTPRSLMGLLAAGRAEVVVLERSMAQALVAELGIADARVLDPPLESRPMYLFLHRSHSQHTASLARALRGLKADGTWARLAHDVWGDAAPAPPPPPLEVHDEPR